MSRAFKKNLTFFENSQVKILIKYISITKHWQMMPYVTAGVIFEVILPQIFIKKKKKSQSEYEQG